MDKEGRHTLRLAVSSEFCQKTVPVYEVTNASSLTVARVQQAAVTSALGRDIAVRNPGTYKLISGSFSGHSVTEPGSRACQDATGSHTFSFITLPLRALAWLLSLPHLYEVP